MHKKKINRTLSDQIQNGNRINFTHSQPEKKTISPMH